MRFFLFFVSLLFLQASMAEDHLKTVRIGVLPFGSLNWEISVLRSEGLDQKARLQIETITAANAEAGKIALLGNQVDIIVSDWIWVASQREQHRDFQFYPYATTLGALMVPPHSPIRTVSDLKNRKLGVAGGSLDKNWLLLKAMVLKTAGLDLSQSASLVFAAPPLINQQLQQGKLDAVLNYWNFAAKLEARGYRKLVDGAALLQGLGFSASIPNLGYVFRGDWAHADTEGARRLFEALRTAKNLICEDDKVWKKLVPLTEETEPAVQDALRANYCAGRVKYFGDPEKKAIAEIYSLLYQAGGVQVTGRSPTLPDQVFWSSDSVGH